MFNRSVPPLSTVAPLAESLTADAGAGPMSARNDHTHPRLVSATRVTLDVNGAATVVYSRSFDAAPVVQLTAINPSGKPVILEQQTDIKTGALWTGCTIHGYRNQNLPAVLTLLTALVNYDVLGSSASGVVVNVLAIKASA